MHLLGGGPTSLAFQAVREEMSAAYAVGGNLVWASRMSLVELQGQFEPDKIVDALGALAASIGRLRGSPPADADVARAKAALIAGIRSRVSTNAGLTAGMIDSIVVGGPPDECAEADAIRSVGATDVQRVVRRYLGNHDVHVVAVGDATTLRGPLEQLGFGAPRLRDGFGRDAN
jgi:predicted Zn-dependent peptidase